MDDDAYTLESLERRLARLERRLERLEVSELADRAAAMSHAAPPPLAPPPHPIARRSVPTPTAPAAPVAPVAPVAATDRKSVV